MRNHFKLLLITGMLGTLLVGQIARAQYSLREYTVKAAFLYNFAKFIEWPADAFEDAQAPLILCILGKDPFGPALNAIRQKTVRNRKLVIRHCERLEDLGTCHILFISGSEKKDLVNILDTLNDPVQLTVGDMQGFAKDGGIINFITEKNKLRFEINVDAAKRSRLKISSKLLKLARIVKDEPKGTVN